MKILLLDNYDSFTFNLLHLVEKIGDYEVVVRRNKEFELSEIEAYDSIILSPGPGLPEESGILLDCIKTYYTHKKILGVCLGHQALAVALGGRLRNLQTVAHGVGSATQVLVPGGLFKGIPNVFNSGRYHSWVVDSAGLPEDFEITAVDEDGNCMAMRHKEFDLNGVQFHPESILTEYGEQMMKNWIEN